MTRLHYHKVDVFTGKPFAGNQLAVFTRGQDVPTELMQAIANEMNLSETTFVLPADDPKHNFRVRIFTPGTEMPAAGHPTVGTTFVLVRERMVSWSEGDRELNLILEEGVGPIPVRVEMDDYEPGAIWMSQPLPRFGPRFEDKAAIAEMLSLPTDAIEADLPLEVVSCGVPFLYVPLRDLQAIRNLRFRLDISERLLMSGGEQLPVFLFTREVENAGSTVHSRMFAPSLGVSEDPATGIASGPLGSYMVRYGMVSSEEGTAHIVSEQGIELGRPSFIHIEIDSRGEEITGVRVGGRCVKIGEGFIEL